jgi:[ribosomal protein S18]-alanine N-acetyltransferase
VRQLAPTFEIRAMTSADLDRVMDLQRRSFTHPWTTEMVKKELTQDWSTVLLAEENQKLLGISIFWLVHDELHLLNIATDPDHRQQGVARALLEATLASGRAHKCRIATLEVRRSNGPALALYQNHGFRPVGLRPNYYADDREDAVVMMKDF